MIHRVSSYFSKVDHSATQAELKNMNTFNKVKRHRNSDTKSRQQRTCNFVLNYTPVLGPFGVKRHFYGHLSFLLRINSLLLFVVSVRIIFESGGESKKFSFYVVLRLGGEFILFSFFLF